MQWFRRLLPVFGFLILSTGLASAQQQYGGISGEIHIARGDFPGRILVELQSRGAAIASVYSDEQGKFGFTGLEANPYHVVIRDDRFYPVDQLVNVDPSIISISRAQVQLTLRDNLPKRQDSPRIAGSNPYIIDLSEYKRRFPKKAVKEFDRGVESDANGKADSAIRHYEKALSLAPDFYPAHNNLGSDYLSKANFGGAEKEFREAIRLNRSDSQAYFNLGNVLVLTKQYPQADLVLHEGLQRRPDSAFAHFLLGSLYSRTGQLPEAERNLNQALQLDPTMSQTYLQLVNLYMQENRRPEAVAKLQAFLHAFPDGPYVAKAREVLKKLQSEASETRAR